jgi:hypothetical protein
VAIPQPQAHGVNDNEEPDFEWNRIANPHRRVNRLVKAREILRQNDAAIHKTQHYGTYSPMNDQFSSNEDWECYQKSRMHFDIVKERNVAAPAGSGRKKSQE